MAFFSNVFSDTAYLKDPVELVKNDFLNVYSNFLFVQKTYRIWKSAYLNVCLLSAVNQSPR